MGQLSSVEKQSKLEWLSAIYKDVNGTEYDIVFTSSYDFNIGYGEKELMGVELNEEVIGEEEPIWREIKKAVKAWEG